MSQVFQINDIENLLGFFFKIDFFHRLFIISSSDLTFIFALHSFTKTATPLFEFLAMPVNYCGIIQRFSNTENVKGKK